ncbi:hypothetical protein [Nitrospira lenta]|uniref:Uncharacterized protein n=1 Tax=Nitrospira lenta TaxID=1436998 RepID=A0A330L9Q3_9BACT|nr:hypothetical protein [Nitrospira lenta]SPP66612.1 conserved hypothetical protein [Nitrospira lenta]
MPIRPDTSFTGYFNSERRRQFYEGHRSLALTMILIVFLSPFAGLYVANLFGAVIGVLLSFVAYYVTPCIWQKAGG